MKKKSTKTILKKKTKKIIKNHMEKHCSNSQYFKEKTTKQNSQPAQYEKNKINNDHFGKKKGEKIHKKRKNNHVGKHCSNP